MCVHGVEGQKITLTELLPSFYLYMDLRIELRLSGLLLLSTH